MPKVFLSHKSQEKREVLHIQKYLHTCLIKTWLDKDQLQGGSDLLNTFYEAVEGNSYFVPFISERYLESDWCMEELETAMLEKSKIIPVVFGDIVAIQAKADAKVRKLLKAKKYIHLNEYDLDKTAQAIADSIWKDYEIGFAAVTKESIGDLSFLEVHVKSNVERISENVFEHWNFSIRDFLDDPPFDTGLPIAFEGRLPNWMYSYLSIPLFNNREVLLYNYGSKGYVCVYSPFSKAMQGRFFKKEISGD